MQQIKAIQWKQISVVMQFKIHFHFANSNHSVTKNATTNTIAQINDNITQNSTEIVE